MTKELVGTVISDKMQQTVVVRVVHKFKHPKYGKVITRHKKFKAHNEDVNIKKGDLVSIKEVRPISKEKKFIVVEKLLNQKN